jgi:hypothetical protein
MRLPLAGSVASCDDQTMRSAEPPPPISETCENERLYDLLRLAQLSEEELAEDFGALGEDGLRELKNELRELRGVEGI